MDRVLVTGGGGFIGSHLVHALLREGYEVRVLDNFSLGNRENLEEVADSAELIDDPNGILSAEVCRRAMNGVRYVLHQGAIGSVPRSVSDPLSTDQVNIGGTLNLLEAARKAGAERFVYASSSSVYGTSPNEIRREAETPAPLSPYAVSKYACEMYAGVYSRLHQMETVGLRYFNVFGPRQDPTSAYAAVIPRFIHHLLCGERPTIFGDGEQSRDFTYVDNVVAGNLLALKAEGIGGEVFNLAAGARCTVNELFRTLRKLTGSHHIEPIYDAPRPGDVLHSRADISKAALRLGFKPSVGLEEGLSHTLEWFKCSARTTR